MIEYTITAKDDSNKVIVKELIEEPFILSRDSEQIQGTIRQALAMLKVDPNSEAPEIVLKSTMVIQ